MSDPINANPTIIDVADLPTRLNNDNNNNNDNNYQTTNKLNLKNKQMISQLVSLSLLNPDESPEAADDETSLSSDEENEDDDFDPIDEQEIFDLIATISDPEHPLTLAQLAVVNLSDIKITNPPNCGGDGGGDGGGGGISEVLIKITPTITHCSLATLIGLGIRVRLDRSLPSRYRIKILIKEGTHQLENQVNKQLNDKERVAAACENDQLLNVILQMLSTCK